MATAWLDFKDHRITAHRGVGVVRLTMSLRCIASADRMSAATPYDLRGELSLEVPNSSPLYITTCRSARPFWFREGNKAELTVHAEMTPHQLEDIEDLRAGDNLTFQADFTISALVADDPAWAVLDGHQARLNVEAATWADALTQSGVAAHLLLVVPAPPATADWRIVEAWNYWQTARDALIGGRWPDAVGTSRKVVELLGYKKEPDASAIDRTKAQRWHSLGYAFYRLASAPNHADDVTIEMEWTRQDAVAAVAVAGGLVKAGLPPTRP